MVSFSYSQTMIRRTSKGERQGLWTGILIAFLEWSLSLSNQFSCSRRTNEKSSWDTKKDESFDKPCEKKRSQPIFIILVTSGDCFFRICWWLQQSHLSRSSDSTENPYWLNATFAFSSHQSDHWERWWQSLTDVFQQRLFKETERADSCHGIRTSMRAACGIQLPAKRFKRISSK